MSGYNKLPTSDEGEIEMEPVASLAGVTSPAGAAAGSAAGPTAPSAAASVPAPAPATNAASLPAAGASAASARPVAQPADGVFSNLAPKADLPPKYANDPLPTYGDAVVDTAPLQGYSGAVVLTPTSALQDIQVDGVAVGTTGTFFATLFISWLFGLVGFLCSFMLSASHAGRSGARAGIGLQFMHWGIYMRSLMFVSESEDHGQQGSDSHAEGGSGEHDGDHYSYNSAQAQLPMWVSYLLIVLGWLLFVHGCSVYYHVRRIVRARQLTILAA